MSFSDITRYRMDLGLLLLRLTIGFTMLFAHGLSKLERFPELSQRFADPLGIGSFSSLTLAVSAEVLASIFIVFGLLTRFVSIPLIFTMIIAFFVIHGVDPFSSKEKALLFGSGYAILLLTGPGHFSLDALLTRRFPALERILL
ncbi:DoxX family protein [bacterium]|nr:DoxX family protein [bacterium]